MEKKSTIFHTFNNEVDFCKVYDLDTKRQIEKILLDNGISYYCHFEDKGILQRFFFMKPGAKTACIFRIHDEEVPRAKELVRNVLGPTKNKRKETRR